MSEDSAGGFRPVGETIIGTLRKYIFPTEEERDPRFKKELDAISVLGLRVVAGLCLMWSSFILAMGATFLPEISAIFGLGHPMVILTIGLVAMALSFLPLSGSARQIGLLVGYLIAIVEIWGSLNLGFHPLEVGHVIPRVVIMVLLVILASIALKPIHTLALGAAITLTYWGILFLTASVHLGPAVYASLFVMANVSVMATAMTTAIYHWRAKSFRARRSTEQALDRLREAQSQLVVSANAASQLRFAAAMSHELNTPIGTLNSSLDTLLLALDKWREQPDDRGRFERVLRDAAQAGRLSMNRLRDTVDRMKHLTNLDRAETQPIDLNELWIDTIAHLQPQLDSKPDVRMYFAPLPRIAIRPQQIGAVFSNLLRNAASAIENAGTITVRSSQRRGSIVLEVEDDGRGIPADRLQHLFDLDFQVKGGIVSTTNWGLFVSRSIITEHGGQLEIESIEGKGTLARIRLPMTGE
jgi:signal transduction histidine kinase